MLLKATALSKSIGAKDIFTNLSFLINEGEKVALIGRNGCGKTTLFKILAGEDPEYGGKVELQKNITTILTKQEHFLEKEITALDYILDNVPDYRKLKQIVNGYESGVSEVDLESYLDALHDFSTKGYFEVESRILQSLSDFQISEERSIDSLKDFSGGEKRFVELVRVMYSEADLAFIDEPTNHLDLPSMALLFISLMTLILSIRLEVMYWKLNSFMTYNN